MPDLTGYYPGQNTLMGGLMPSIGTDEVPEWMLTPTPDTPQTPQDIQAWQQQYWLPQIATGGYIPPEFDNPEAMAALGQTDAYNQRMQYLNQVGAQRVSTLMEGIENQRSGAGWGGNAPVAQLYALAGMGLGTAGVLGGAAGAGAGGLSPISTGASTLPGGIPAIEGAASGAFGGAIPAMAAYPSMGAISGALTGATGGALGGAIPPGGIPDINSGGTIPGTESVALPSGMDKFRDILGQLGGTLTGATGGYGAQQQGGTDNSALMQMMSQLLQRQRIPTPQGPTGPRYRPYG